ncbi:homocysteine S-methyltransferase family protein [Aestuariivivens sediminis]|uniref:homocysteine S-methyltransferase family protein n=1 Tax=Aestuariivivens sediminis TaxID=2913557 RepID=UPI001F591232|nr:homocysteine S-methyltransferase family protein [Aestuariivivens sediminis]
MNIIEKLKAPVFLTDGGLETDFIFNKGIDLPHFAAFTLLDHPEHQNTLDQYYRDYIAIAKKYQTGFILESATWRANPDWGYKLGYTIPDLITVNQNAIRQLIRLRDTHAPSVGPIIISGCVGPRGDGYTIKESMTPKEAKHYHSPQIEALTKGGADIVSAITMTYSEEAIGISHAAKSINIPVVISFTVETNGQLPSGELLKDAILTTDKATAQYPLYYMINCAHPTHFMERIEKDDTWKLRIQGVRANASCKSHEALDQATALDAGDREELGRLYARLKTQLPQLKVIGGCCGTDATHIESICAHAL